MRYLPAQRARSDEGTAAEGLNFRARRAPRQSHRRYRTFEADGNRDRSRGSLPAVPDEQEHPPVGYDQARIVALRQEHDVNEIRHRDDLLALRRILALAFLVGQAQLSL